MTYNEGHEADPVESTIDSMDRLRQLANSRLPPTDSHIDEMSEQQLKHLIHELQVHEFELSIQNEELRDAQLRLAEARDQYLALYDRAPIAYLTLTESGCISACNLATARLLGVPREKLTGRHLYDFICPGYQNDFLMHWQRLMQYEDHQVTELEIKSAQGSIDVRMESQWASSDAVCDHASWHAALTDITAQKTLQRDLCQLNRELEQRVTQRTRRYEESRQELDAILNTVVDAVITFDRTGKIEHANRAAEQMLEYQPGEMLGLNIRQLVPASNLDQQENFFHHFMCDPHGQLKNSAELAARTKSGDRIPTTISIAQADHQDKFTAVLRDIREIKLLQRDVLNTAEYERSRISRELHDSLGQELVGISMLAKSFATEHAADGEIAAEMAGYCLRFSRLLDTCVNELRQIIFDLAPLELSHGSLADALQNLVNRVNQHPNTKCRLYCDVPDSGAGAEVDIQLLRIAREAVHNALKHANAHNIDVHLSGKKNHLCLRIADDGKGMPVNGIVDAKSQGIRIMQYRANVLGGKLLVAPNHPNGTLVTCLIAKDH